MKLKGISIAMEKPIYVNRKGTNCYKWDPAEPALWNHGFYSSYRC